MAHPLLISLANIMMEYHNKCSHHTFLLLGVLTLLLIPKFLMQDKKLQGVLENHLLHECLDFVLDPLKKAAQLSIMLMDPLSFAQYCFTPLAAYIANTPEAAMLSGVAGKMSYLTIATYKQFGDSFWHELRMVSTTLAQLHAVSSKFDPIQDIKLMFMKPKRFG
jgi:Plavaka transposase